MSNQQSNAITISDDTRYDVVDQRTGRVMRSYRYAQRNAARRYRDKLDLAWGAVRYQCRVVASAGERKR